MASGASAKPAQGAGAAAGQPRAPTPSAWLPGCPLVSSHRGGHSPEAAAHRPEGGADKNAEEDSITSSTEMKIQILGQINSERPRLSDKPGPDDSWPTSASQDFDFGTKEGTAKSAMEAKEDGVGVIENVPPEQTVNGSLTSAGGVHKNYRSDMMSASELGEEDDVESPSLPEVELGT
ncbi:ankyrin repeat domain-containing protein 26-like isoform X2 [Felis catus]|uniref:ankyrin repeat domain-containing protein 26-like isoform X2 n=1 Tax=Felis catus TaxID=9685 RepID=UPI001D199C4E|nr:ankyrin repeat domain-containing protein 26-like isoform X2 [Felis catus]